MVDLEPSKELAKSESWKGIVDAPGPQTLHQSIFRNPISTDKRSCALVTWSAPKTSIEATHADAARDPNNVSESDFAKMLSIIIVDKCKIKGSNRFHMLIVREPHLNRIRETLRVALIERCPTHLHCLVVWDESHTKMCKLSEEFAAKFHTKLDVRVSGDGNDTWSSLHMAKYLDFCFLTRT
jgi:hypothetical protein